MRETRHKRSHAIWNSKKQDYSNRKQASGHLWPRAGEGIYLKEAGAYFLEWLNHILIVAGPHNCTLLQKFIKLLRLNWVTFTVCRLHLKLEKSKQKQKSFLKFLGGNKLFSFLCIFFTFLSAFITHYVALSIESGRSPGGGMATHSSILAWRIPMDRGAWRWLQSMGSQRVGHDWVTAQHICNFVFRHFISQFHISTKFWWL